MSGKKGECELEGTLEQKPLATRRKIMGKTMTLATVIVVGATIIGGMPVALWMCAFSPLIGAGLWGFAKTVKWM